MSKITKRNSNNEMKINKYAVEQQNNKVQSILDGTAELKDLLSVKDAVIDFAKCTRKIKTIQLIYSAGSQVGACTVVAGNMYTVKITDASMEGYKKSLKMLKDKETHVPYGDSIWVEGYNMFSEFSFETGHRYTYYVVTNEEMKQLANKISAMDYNSVTKEDIETLQADLPPFVRAWQESSIDVSKDKDKVFNYQFSDFFKKVDTVSTYLKAHADGITANLNELAVLHKAGRDKDMRFRITLPLENTEKPVYDDMLGDVNKEIANSLEEYFNGSMLELLKKSDRNYYKQYADACLPYPELAMYIHQIYTLIGHSYQEDVKIEKEQFAMFRDAIYSKAAVYGVKDEEVVKVAVSVAMRYVKEATDKQGKKYIDLGIADVKNYKQSKVINIFPDEYVALRTGVKETKELTLLYVDKNTRIEEGETVEFVAGFSVDDTVEVEELFTGVAYNKEGKLIYDVNPYEFNKVSTIITLATFDAEATTASQTTDEGEFMCEFLNNNEDVIIAGKNKNVLVGADGKTLVAKVVTSPELMPKGKAAAYKVTNYISYQPNAGKNRIFFITLQ